MYEIYIFFPSHYTFHRKIPDSKLNCISKNLSFPYFPLWFITALDRRTSHPFSFQFKTIPNRVSHEFLQNGARLGSKWRAVLDFSMVKHGCYKHVVLSVPSDIAFSVFHDSYASLSLLAARKKGEIVERGRIYGAARDSWRIEAIAGEAGNGRPPFLSSISAVDGLTRTSLSTRPSAFPRFNAWRRDRWISKEGGREGGNLVANWKRALPPWIRYIYIFSIDDERRVRRAY